MMYRYGDSTPFPLEENFIETICAATDACVALFRADVSAEERRRNIDAIRKHADQELKRLHVLGRAVEAALRPMLPEAKAERTSEATASRISQSTRGSIRQARSSVERRRDAAIRGAKGTALCTQIFDALSALLIEHQLPRAKWTVRWLWDNERGAPQIVLKMRSRACDLDGEFELDLPEQHRWSAPVRVADLAPDLTIRIQRPPTRLRRRGTKNQPLHRYYITEAEFSPERSSFVLRTSYKKPAPGFLVVMREKDSAIPRIERITADAAAEGQPMALSSDSAVALGALWERIESGMRSIRRHRNELVGGRFEGVDLEEFDDPAGLAETILCSLAPLVREMRLRSRVPGELVLKKDRGDGRREELFVPRAQLDAKFSALPLEHRRVFESIGLSSEATCEFVGREFPLTAPTGTTPPPMQSKSPTPSQSAPPRKPTMSSLPDLPIPPKRGNRPGGAANDESRPIIVSA